ncbi:MAG: redoxin domain-containing (seleno)protein, partial [Gammaproteobacteria bacterium]|nr:redoxin domain-containing (seleno)protein [Gammaproteobacteria bacterium]
MKKILGLFLVFAPPLVLGHATVLFEQNVVTISETLADPTDLWVTTEDLTRVNGFELKPEGACLDEICVPVKQDEDSDLFVRRDGRAWFNVTELADRLQQPVVVDHQASVFSFGAI